MKVLIIGSGPIVIGQAAEFDYSGTQACLACRDAGVHTVLVNANPATIGTDPQVAGTVYIEPLTVGSVEAIIARERPDGVIATVGGQTALNLAVALDQRGVLSRYGVAVLGTGLDTIRRGEDRALFAATLQSIGQPVLPSRAVESVEEALAAAESIGYPVMCRSAFALGGAGSGFAADREELARRALAGLQASGSGQVLIEGSVRGWAEIEYEVVRDRAGNCLVVCNMENLDPMGVHTGESIVVAPSQTLSDTEYHTLRAASIAVVRALGVEGACNVQFALDRDSGRYVVIEVNPRLSRSSALASKATGYPIARVATRIALGATLPEIRNDITGTSAMFEPALDYVVAKIPRWPFDKFPELSPTIGTSMQSTGEVMAIGRSVEEALVKAMRSCETSLLDQAGVLQRDRSQPGWAPASLEEALAVPNAARLPALVAALDRGWEPARVAELSGIHPWFVERLRDWSVGTVPGGPVVYKMVDTCAGEFEARTPYFYGTQEPGSRNEAVPLPGPKALILGAGPIRIGQGIEFDYSTVHACWAMEDAGVRSIIVNNNPETVSTDYSTADRLYVEPLDVDAVMDVIRHEEAGLLGVIPQFGGQTAINLVRPLQERGVRILGTSPTSIAAAEDRAQAAAALAREGIPLPAWRSVSRWDDLAAAVRDVGYPALLRPSYVLSGQGMTIVRTAEDVDRYAALHGAVPLRDPLLVDHFLEGAVELNVDAVSDGEDTVMVAMEQLEECGVHSGDSWDVYPLQSVSPRVARIVEAYTRQLARAFGIVGLLNVQYAVQGEQVYVLEVNPRASRSVPFASKASGLPLADLAVGAILGRRLAGMDVPAPRTDRVAVKAVVFPYRALRGAIPISGPQMRSTGEAMGRGRTFGEAYWKAWAGTGAALPHGRPIYARGPRARDLACALGSPLVSHTDVDVAGLGFVVAIDPTPDEVELLRRAAPVVPVITSSGAVQGLLRACEDGEPVVSPEPLGGLRQRGGLSEAVSLAG